MEFSELLVSYHVCPDSYKFSVGKTAEEAINTCNRVDWLCYLADRFLFELDERKMVMFKWRVMQLVPQYVLDKYGFIKELSKYLQSSYDYGSGKMSAFDFEKVIIEWRKLGFERNFTYYHEALSHCIRRRTNLYPFYSYVNYFIMRHHDMRHHDNYGVEDGYANLLKRTKEGAKIFRELLGDDLTVCVNNRLEYVDKHGFSMLEED
jgi:hypothetical protein